MPHSNARRNAAVFVAISVVYLCCPVKGVGDLFWSLPTVVSILHEGNTDLDEFQAGFHHNAGAVEKVGEHYRNFFPIGSALVALVPIAAFNGFVNLIEPASSAIPAIHRQVKNWQRDFNRTGDIDAGFFVVTEMVLASLLMALASIFILLMASELLPWAYALAVTAVFAFASSVFSTASRDLGQHGPSVLMLSIALWLLVRGRRVPSGVPWAGLFVGLSYLMRPTNSLSVVFLSALVLVRYRRQLIPYCLLGGVVAAVFFLYNHSVYSAFLPPYYQPERILPQSAALFFEAAAGNLVSPARGLFVYSPIFLFAAWGLVMGVRSSNLRVEAIVLGTIIVLHWLVVSSFPHWWAGYSYGPRYLTDMTPYLCFLLIPVMQRLAGSDLHLQQRRVLLSVLCILGTWSVFTHLRGSMSYAGPDWNGSPLDVDTHPERLWDFKDPAFFRGLRR